MTAADLLPRLATPPDRLAPGAAGRLVGMLGPAAPWLLCDAALARLADEDPAVDRLPRPAPPAAAGACGILYAVNVAAYPLARPAFLLPLQWRPGPGHDAGLPARLRALADRVLQHLGPAADWSLHRLPPFDRLPLAGVDTALDHESGWAPLAGGLLAARGGVRTAPRVLATGRWDGNQGVVPVGGLPAKLALARDLGADVVFVPEDQAATPADGPRRGRLLRGLRSPAGALREYLAALDLPPGTDAPAADRRAYYNRRPVDGGLAAAYYRSHLLPEVVARQRELVARDWPGWSPAHLITVTSTSPELILVAAGALGVRRCLLLHTDLPGDRMAEKAAEYAALLRAAAPPVDATPKPFADGPAMAPAMCREIAAFTAGVPPADLVFDLTPGSKLMTLGLEQLARRVWPAGWLIYLRHQLENRRIQPFTERLMRWRAGDAGGPFATCAGP